MNNNPGLLQLFVSGGLFTFLGAIAVALLSRAKNNADAAKSIAEGSATLIEQLRRQLEDSNRTVKNQGKRMDWLQVVNTRMLIHIERLQALDAERDQYLDQLAYKAKEEGWDIDDPPRARIDALKLPPEPALD